MNKNDDTGLVATRNVVDVLMYIIYIIYMIYDTVYRIGIVCRNLSTLSRYEHFFVYEVALISENWHVLFVLPLSLPFSSLLSASHCFSLDLFFSGFVSHCCSSFLIVYQFVSESLIVSEYLNVHALWERVPVG